MGRRDVPLGLAAISVILAASLAGPIVAAIFVS